MPGTSRFFAALLTLGVLSGCSSPTEADGPARASVQVDPMVIQTIHYFGTADSVVNDPRLDHEDIACLNAVPQTCWVSEVVRATVQNTGERSITYSLRCGGPLQRRTDGGGWSYIAFFCNLPYIPPFEIRPGERLTFDVGIVQPPGEYRVVAELFDGYLELPLAMRASEPFKIQLR